MVIYIFRLVVVSRTLQCTWRVSIQQSCFVFGTFRFGIWIWRPALLTESVCGFSQSIYEPSALLPCNGPWSCHFRCLSIQYLICEAKKASSGNPRTNHAKRSQYIKQVAQCRIKKCKFSFSDLHYWKVATWRNAKLRGKRYTELIQ